MCGIVGYIGKQKSLQIGLSALKRLEYRGYDSAGLAVFNSEKNEVFCLKTAGRIDSLEKKIAKANLDLEGSPAIYHTRWATHGGVTDENAHPHSDCRGNIWVVHNGIIENYQELKEELIKEGHKFSSETDTEVVAHLIEKYFEGNLEEAVRKALRQVRGAYALVIISRDDPCKMVVARLSSPLVIGVTGTEYLIASDAAAIAPYTKKAINLEDNEIAVISSKKFYILKERQPEELEIEVGDVQKKGYPHFMLKEIMEGPTSVENAIRGRLVSEDGSVRLGGLDLVSDKLREIDRLILVACGTAYYASMIGEYMLEEYAGIPTEVDIGSEFRYRKPILDKNTTAIFVSQSGETADTLAGLREMKEKGVLTLGITNVVGSSQARETDAGVYIRSGPEIAVASTKAFLNQLTTLAMFTIYLGRQRDLSLIKGKRIAQDLQKIPEQIREVLKQSDRIKAISEKYSKFNNFIYLGRKYNYPIALEGALKLKEIAYPIHAEGYAGGELKHGPLALADENFPFISVVPQDSVYEKMLSNMEEVKARKAPIIAVATAGDEKIKKIADDIIYIPHTSEMLTPILSVVPLQLFAYHMGVLRGCDVDKPRNLAKSVTVE